MKRLTRTEVRVERLLRASRSIAVLGARRDDAVVEFLKQEGFDVFPVRTDREEVAGLASWASLADVPGRVDIVLVLPRARVDATTIDVAAQKGARALWLSRDATAADAEARAAAHDLLVVRGHDIVAEQRHTERVAGQPAKRGVNVGGRKGMYEDDRKHRVESGWVPRGGGGHKGGGGERAVLDEKKMVGGKPSPRRGPLRRPH